MIKWRSRGTSLFGGTAPLVIGVKTAAYVSEAGLGHLKGNESESLESIRAFDQAMFLEVRRMLGFFAAGKTATR